MKISKSMNYGVISDDEYEPLVLPEGRGDRHRRVTCDLLSYKGVVGDSACAANCLSLGKAGGRCHDGVCTCRKYVIPHIFLFAKEDFLTFFVSNCFRTTFKEVWDKRFG